MASSNGVVAMLEKLTDGTERICCNCRGIKHKIDIAENNFFVCAECVRTKKPCVVFNMCCSWAKCPGLPAPGSPTGNVCTTVPMCKLHMAKIHGVYWEKLGMCIPCGIPTLNSSAANREYKEEQTKEYYNARKRAKHSAMVADIIQQTRETQFETDRMHLMVNEVNDKVNSHWLPWNSKRGNDESDINDAESDINDAESDINDAENDINDAESDINSKRGPGNNDEAEIPDELSTGRFM